LISKNIGNLRAAVQLPPQARGSTPRRRKYRKELEIRIKGGRKQCQYEIDYSSGSI
jgi:hypothetical protein